VGGSCSYSDARFWCCSAPGAAFGSWYDLSCGASALAPFFQSDDGAGGVVVGDRALAIDLAGNYGIVLPGKPLATFSFDVIGSFFLLWLLVQLVHPFTSSWVITFTVPPPPATQ
jgi:hypothetical protein